MDGGVPVGQFWQEGACPHRSSSAVACGQRWRGPVAARPAPMTARRPPGAPRTVPTAPAAAPQLAAGPGGGGGTAEQVRAGSTGRCWCCERSAAHGVSLQDCWAQPASACGCSRRHPARPRHRSLAQPRRTAPRPRCCVGTRGTQVSAGCPLWDAGVPCAPSPPRFPPQGQRSRFLPPRWSWWPWAPSLLLWVCWAATAPRGATAASTRRGHQGSPAPWPWPPLELTVPRFLPWTLLLREPTCFGNKGGTKLDCCRVSWVRPWVLGLRLVLVPPCTPECPVGHPMLPTVPGACTLLCFPLCCPKMHPQWRHPLTGGAPVGAGGRDGASGGEGGERGGGGGGLCPQ